MSIRISQRITLAALLAMSFACGSPSEQKSRRTLGATDDGLDSRKVRASDDATGQQGQNDGEGDGGTDGQANNPGGETDGATDGATDGDPGNEPGKEEPNPATVFVKSGLRNYEQINATMSAVTGVPRSNATVRTEFTTNLATSLPTDNDVRAFLGSQQVAVFKLAVEYCDALVKDTTLRGNVFGAFNFGATPAVAFDNAGKQALADALVTKFWGKDLASLPAHGDSVDQVVGVIDDLLVGKNLNTVAVTPAVATAVCTATLASAPVTMF